MAGAPSASIPIAGRFRYRAFTTTPGGDRSVREATRTARASSRRLSRGRSIRKRRRPPRHRLNRLRPPPPLRLQLPRLLPRTPHRRLHPPPRTSRHNRLPLHRRIRRTALTTRSFPHITPPLPHPLSR